MRLCMHLFVCLCVCMCTCVCVCSRSTCTHRALLLLLCRCHCNCCHLFAAVCRLLASLRFHFFFFFLPHTNGIPNRPVTFFVHANNTTVVQRRHRARVSITRDRINMAGWLRASDNNGRATTSGSSCHHRVAISSGSFAGLVARNDVAWTVICSRHRLSSCNLWPPVHTSR